LIILLLALAVGYGVNALRGHDGHPAPASTSVSATSGAVALSALPAQAAETVALIRRGGPYPYRQDGVVFDNAEHHLPGHPRGYYHEYTVQTPSSEDRGARRIIAGQAGEFYYTGDHYESFVRVDIDR
jgi:ribonuclease T1